jgi:hypothetical protein
MPLQVRLGVRCTAQAQEVIALLESSSPAALHFINACPVDTHQVSGTMESAHASAAADDDDLCLDPPPPKKTHPPLQYAGWLAIGPVSSCWGCRKAPSALQGQPPLLPQPPRRPLAATRRRLLRPLLLMTAGRC